MKTKIVAKNFPLVCVGGSAGGLDAYIKLLKNFPVDMPETAINSGYIDFILSPEEIVGKLIKIAKEENKQ